jgi:hypothetical protein
MLVKSQSMGPFVTGLFHLVSCQHSFPFNGLVIFHHVGRPVLFIHASVSAHGSSFSAFVPALVIIIMSCSLVVAILVGGRWPLIVLLICTSTVVTGVEHLRVISVRFGHL